MSIEVITDSNNDNTKTPTPFTRAVVESMGSHIKLSDRDEESNLDLFCYIKCDSTDNEIVKQCRGVIFNGDKIVMKAFPYTEEYNTYDRKKIDINLDNTTFYDSQEGSLIRLFYFNNKWFTSTHRKFNAFKSKWAAKDSFGTIFKKALDAEYESNESFRNRLKDDLGTGEHTNLLDRFQGSLDVSKQYMFLVTNTDENCVVCEERSVPSLYHVGTFVNGNLEMPTETNNVNVQYQNPLKFATVDDLYDYVDKIDFRKQQGVIGFTSDNTQFKILNKNYEDFFRIRGNEPSIKFRYLQVRMDKDLTDKLFYLYPKMNDMFEKYENILYDIALSIHDNYVKRFIKKNYVIVPREEFEIIRKAHDWYLSDRDHHKIDINKVIDIMNEQSPTILNHLIRQHEIALKKIADGIVDDPIVLPIRTNKSLLKRTVVKVVGKV